MRKPHLFAVVLALAAVSLLPCLAAKVTDDPNAGSDTPAVSAASGADPLTQPVTYEGGYKRLHYVVEDLGAKTGVTIRCGTNKDDWQVRDLPLTVSARDIPLGKLLEAITSATNLEIVAETVKNDAGQAEKQYRLSLSTRARTALENYVAKQQAESRAEQEQAWDALVANADIPDSDVDTASNPRAQAARDIAKILKHLGPEAKAKVMAGEGIDIAPGTYPDPALMRDLYLASRQSYGSLVEQGAEPTEDEVNSVTLSIKPSEDTGTGRFNIMAVVTPVKIGNLVLASPTVLSSAAQLVWKQTRGHKPPSGLPKPAATSDMPDHIAKDLLPLDIKADAKDPAPLLSRKVKLDLPKDKDVTYADAIDALAKAAGVTIVAENYLDHRRRPQMMTSIASSGGRDGSRITITTSGGIPPNMAGKIPQMSWLKSDPPTGPFSPVSGLPDETTVGDVLRALSKGGVGPMMQFEWFCNEKSKLLVGRASNWVTQHQNLMPEALLVDLRRKADTKGIELDDITRLTHYTLAQRTEWVTMSKNLSFLAGVSMMHSISDILWRLYENLTPDDKAMAKSPGGLPLAKYDAAWVAEFNKAGMRNDSTIRLMSAGAGMQKKLLDDARKQKELLTNPEAIRRLTLGIVGEPAQLIPSFVNGSIAFTSASVAGRSDRHTYRPVLTGDYKGENVDIKLDPIYPSFPVYSPEREAELEKPQAPPG